MLKEKQRNGTYNEFSIVETVLSYNYSYRNQTDSIIVLQMVIGILIYKHDHKISHLKHISPNSGYVHDIGFSFYEPVTANSAVQGLA